MELTLYLENGEELVFENVTDFEPVSYMKGLIKFNYISVHDGKKKKAFFNISSFGSFAGLSVDKEDFDVNSLF